MLFQHPTELQKRPCQPPILDFFAIVAFEPSSSVFTFHRALRRSLSKMKVHQIRFSLKELCNPTNPVQTPLSPYYAQTNIFVCCADCHAQKSGKVHLQKGSFVKNLQPKRWTGRQTEKKKLIVLRLADDVLSDQLVRVFKLRVDFVAKIPRHLMLARCLTSCRTN